ncbi:MAG: redoxin domain-containing protein [Candidatus Cyclobacteriaceae bacterium M2_1C_046]
MRILFILSFMFFACSAGTKEKAETKNGDTITIKGTVGYPQQGEIVLEKIENNEAVPYDTFNLTENNTFQEEVMIEEHGYYRMNFYNKQYVMLILEDDDVRIDVDGNSRSGFVKIEGSDAHNLINEVQLTQQNFQQNPEFARINQEFNEAVQQRNLQRQEELQEEYMEMEAELNEQLMQKMDSAGLTLGVVDLLASGRVLDKDKYFKYYDKKAKQFAEAMPENDRVEDFTEQVDKMRITAIGEVAPEIALPNPEGDTVKLSSLRGNYVLVDFWAKWCKPCRVENPNIVRMYNKYKDENFEVFGVSLDRNKKDWVQAIEEDNLDWTQVSDLKFWNSEAAQTYGVNAIPFALLLDPEGKIIAKNLRGKELENKLEEIFGE